MSENQLGKLFKVTTFGESHGPAIGCVIDGCPPGLKITQQDIQQECNRRRPGQSRHVTQRQEADQVEILSGIFENQTTGTPIALLIRNTDHKSNDYLDIAENFRPGHADYTYFQKYGIRDYRGGGRSSARLTAPVVAAAAIAKKWLREKYGVLIRGYLSALGPIDIPFVDWKYVQDNPFFSANNEIISQLENFMDQLRRDGDSIGSRIYVEATQVPVGLGAPLFGRLDADLAHAFMSINAVKGVEIGDGFASAAQRGSEHCDAMTPDGFLSNHAGGILGGISTGQTIFASIAIKPTSSIRISQPSIDLTGKPIMVKTLGRHDPCVGLRATPIVEAMFALVLMDHALRHRAQCQDVNVPFKPI